MATEATEEIQELPVLSAPADPLGEIVASPTALAEAIARLRTGTGPIAIDAERAQGYRYSARAYLIQLRRTGAGTMLIDPVPFADGESPADFGALEQAIGGDEWIIHAASQDIPCLAEVGLIPTRLFDTELAGRLLGLPRVALGTLIEVYFGQKLLKEHSAADWSTRPLPDEWLTYAALDVELLIELRDLLAAELHAAGKVEWARQEFAHLAARAAEPPTQRVDPWRRTSGIHAVRNPAGLAIVRELWQARDEIARRQDRAPGRILQDRAIAELAAQQKPTRAAMRGIQGFQRRAARRFESTWTSALERAQALPKSDLPPLHLPSDGPPPPRSWEHRDPAAYARYLALREVVNELAEEHHLPAENLLTPDTWRRLAWQPPAELDVAAIEDFLAGQSARAWQRELTAAALTAALRND
ncbi:MAG: ribonuclease D [Propionibacteriaceae bacterium]|nr:ribonuclease D [Propionibacteriaceae bacterium]